MTSKEFQARFQIYIKALTTLAKKNVDHNVLLNFSKYRVKGHMRHPLAGLMFDKEVSFIGFCQHHGIHTNNNHVSKMPTYGWKISATDLKGQDRAQYITFFSQPLIVSLTNVYETLHIPTDPLIEKYIKLWGHKIYQLWIANNIYINEWWDESAFFKKVLIPSKKEQNINPQNSLITYKNLEDKDLYQGGIGGEHKNTSLVPYSPKPTNLVEYTGPSTLVKKYEKFFHKTYQQRLLPMPNKEPIMISNNTGYTPKNIIIDYDSGEIRAKIHEQGDKNRGLF